MMILESVWTDNIPFVKQMEPQMNDPRIDNLARILVRYSVKARKGELVAVAGDSPAESLVMAVYRELLRVGAFPVIRMMPAGVAEAFFTLAKPHHLNTVTPLRRAEVRHLDAAIRIRANANTRSLSGIDPRKQAALAKTLRPVQQAMLRKRWCLTLYPTNAHAQDAEMSLREFEDFVFAATFADRDDPVGQWKKLSAMQARLIRKVRGAREVRIVGPDTDITMSVEGRKFINSDGTHNMPSGEIFTGPVETSANGYVNFDFPVCVAGREIDGVTLVFRKGRVVEASAGKNEKYLLTMLDMDPGARRLGELGIGTNRMIQRFTKNILFDEKIGGTIHLALGHSIENTGGKNKSALHWDMIKDLRKGGAIYVDGKLFQQDGEFV